jgi:hypothetical protein
METLGQIFKYAASYNIDWAWLIAFAIASALSFFPIHWIVLKLHDRRMNREIEGNENLTGIQRKEKKEALLSHFDLEFAGTIGKLERIVYIFSVMYGAAFAVLSGWLVMKAFTTWLEKQDPNEDLPPAPATAGTPPSAPPADKATMMRIYHLYLYGNVLSLLSGLGLGALGVAVAKILPKAFP